jgi:hypothetical protein
MGLSLYRRHRRDCNANYSEGLRSGEFEERKKSWRRCDCPITVSGTIAGKSRRQSTWQWEWDKARTVAAQWEKANSWDGKVVLPAPEPVLQDRITIELATKSFLDDRLENSAAGTYRKYRLLLKQFKSFCDERGFVIIDQWTPNDVREFRTGWAISHQTASRRLSMLKVFFEYCVSNEWLTRNPARLVKNARGRDAGENRQKLPFTDEELKRMYEACSKYGLTKKFVWTGEDLADFISISIYT